ncbi:MAG: 4a-hydroxytetrahydrobiopterin dehydratase [Actinomycetota bacterium]|jgi:4a-hydroxytetrahydrobiopterin dehydratase|nr:4a-hydroxytetrahydrobiopterin dehydratase [Actinomycetota bacterium]
MPDVLTRDEVDRLVGSELSGWSREGDTLVRSVESETFALGIRLVDSVAVVADELDHHPDIDIRWTTVTFRLSTHSAGGITSNDVELAKRIDALAEQR